MDTMYVLRDAHSGRYWGLVSVTELGWLDSKRNAYKFTLENAKEYVKNNRMIVDIVPA